MLDLYVRCCGRGTGWVVVPLHVLAVAVGGVIGSVLSASALLRAEITTARGRGVLINLSTHAAAFWRHYLCVARWRSGGLSLGPSVPASA
jgi:hypothetical protein